MGLDEADVEEPVAYVAEVQGDASVGRAPASPRPSLKAPEAPEAFAAAGQGPLCTRGVLEDPLAAVDDFREEGLRRVAEL